jgi:hypothetical protein
MARCGGFPSTNGFVLCAQIVSLTPKASYLPSGLIADKFLDVCGPFIQGLAFSSVYSAVAAEERLDSTSGIDDRLVRAVGKQCLDQGVDFALAINEAAGMPRERMGQNIAGAQQRNHPLEYCIDVLTIGAALGQAPQLPKVHIDRKIGAACDRGGHFRSRGYRSVQSRRFRHAP